MNDERGSWYLLTAIILGIGLGLVYAWVISPVEFVDTPPSSLQEDHKDRYRAAIAVAYGATGDRQRAEARLSLLGDDDPALALVEQAQRDLAAGVRVQDAQAMAELAAALGQAPVLLPTLPENTATHTPTTGPSATATATPSSAPSATPTEGPTDTPLPEVTATATLSGTLEVTAGPTLTPTLTKTPLATRVPTLTPTRTQPPTPTATLAPPLVLDNQTSVCNPLITRPQIQIFVSNAAGVGIPGIEVVVIWDGGEEHFYTGFKPDIDPGYADFSMLPETAYTVQVGEGGQLISNLTAPPCTSEDEGDYWGSWRLVFSHP